MLMGYTTSEARRGLRSSQGNIDQAIEFIIEVGETSADDGERTQLIRFRIVVHGKNVAAKNRCKKKKNVCRIVMDEHKMAKSMITGSFNHSPPFLLSIRINVTYLRQLQSMGYPRRPCAEALKQSNNRLEEASEMLLNNIETLIAVSRPSATHEDDDDAEREADLVEDLTHLPQLIALGAEPEIARALLTIHGNRLERAAEEFLQKCKSVADATTEDDSVNNLLERAQKITDRQGRRGNEEVLARDELNSISFPARKKARLDEQATANEQRRTALESIVPDLLRTNDDSEASSMDRDPSGDHLDLLLDEEEVFIRDYRQRLRDDGFGS